VVSDDRDWINEQLDADRNPGPAIIGQRRAQPDTAASANRLARELGLPPVVVERNLPELQQETAARRTVETVRSGSPYLQKWYAEPRNAAAAGDDAPTLKSISNHFRSFWNKPGSNSTDRAVSMGIMRDAANQSRDAETADGFFDRALALGRSGISSLEAGLYQLGGALQEWDANNPLPWTSADSTAAARRKAEQLRARSATVNAVAPVRGATTWADVKARPTAGNIAAFGVESGIQSIPGMAVAGLALPAYVASQAGNIGQTRAQNNGRADASITDVAMAAPAAVASALIERLGIEAVFGRAAGAVASRVGGGAAARVGTRIGFAAAGEAGTEALQSGVEYAGGALGTEKGGNLTEALDQMLQGAIGGAFLGGPLRAAQEAGGRIRAEIRTYAEANRAKAGAVIMDSLMADAEASKLRARDPEAFREFVEGQTQGTPVENIYILAEAIRDLMQDGYRDDPFWSDYAEQIDEALALDGDVVIPTADAAARLAGTDAWRALQPEARFSPGGMSEAELASLEQLQAEGLDRTQAQIVEQMTAAATAAEPAAQVYSQVRDQLANAGFAPDAADRYAQLWAANSETWAARLGMTATDYRKLNPVEFRRILPEALSRVQAVDGLDMTINAMRRDKSAATDRQRFGPSLLEFIAARGGIDDVGGDLASMGADRWHREGRFRRKLVRRSSADVAANAAQGGMLGGAGQTGAGLDDTLQAAIEAGYFPELQRSAELSGDITEGGYSDLPDTQALLDAIDAELRGTPRYAADTPGSASDDVRRAAEDLRGILENSGIDPDKATTAEIRKALDSYRNEQPVGDVPYFDQEGRPLVVVHNLSIAGFRNAEELGGLAAPSIAVIRADLGFSNFGEISLVGSPELAASAGAKAFDADVYSPRQPRARYDLVGPKLRVMLADMKQAADDLGASLDNEFDETTISREGLEAVERSYAAKLTYLRSIGQNVKLAYAAKIPLQPELKGFKGSRYDIADDPNFEPAVRAVIERELADIAARAGEEAANRVGDRWLMEDGTVAFRELQGRAAEVARANGPREVDIYATRRAIDKKMTATKKREGEYQAWIAGKYRDVLGKKFFESRTSGRRQPYEMDALVRDMTRTIRDGEGYNYGVGSLRASVANQFKSITAIKKARNNIVTPDQMEAVKSEASDELFALAERFEHLHRSGKDFGWIDIFSQFMKDLSRGDIREWQKEIFEEPASDELLTEARAYLRKLANLPTEYFEVKVQRPVRFGEFKAAVVPDDTPKDVVDALKGYGLKVATYPRGKDRTEALQKVAERELFQNMEPSGEVFYSQLQRTVEAVKTARAPATQWKATLAKAPGVKAEELEWSGLNDWLDIQTGPVERDAILAMLRDGGIRVDESVLGATIINMGSPYYSPAIGRAIRGEASVEDVARALENDGVAYSEINSQLDKFPELQNPDDPEELDDDWASIVAESLVEESGGARYQSYSSDERNPTYNELLITLPLGEGRNPESAPDTHWDTPAVVAHARFMDKVGPDGERVLFVEEVQSDWHQKGREQGYAQPVDPMAVFEAQQGVQLANDAADAARNDLFAAYDRYRDDMLQAMRAALRVFRERGLSDDQIRDEMGYETEEGIAAIEASNSDERERMPMDRMRIINRDMNLMEKVPEELAAAASAYQAAALRVDEARQRRNDAENINGIPDAPFKKTWPDLVMKRIIAWAAEGGYDQVAWVKQGQNNGGKTNDNVGWFYERDLVNVTNKLLKPYGTKVERLRVDGMRDKSEEYADRLQVTENYAAQFAALPADQQQALRTALDRGLSYVMELGAAVREAQAALGRAADAGRAANRDKAFELYQEADRESAAGNARRAVELRTQAREIIDAPAPDSAIPDNIRAAADDARAAWNEAQDLYDQALRLVVPEGTIDVIKAEMEKLGPAGQPGFTITPELRDAARQGFPLFQGTRGRTTGGIISGQTGPTFIDLFQGSDLSTVIHETGHVWLEEFKRNAMMTGAPDDVKADWETVKAWFAENGAPVGDDGFIPTEAHELWARGFERYTMEGKSPSATLRRAFDAFRGWLLNIYKHVSNLRVDLTPEVRAVFDRMLATEDAINEERARQGVKAMFTDAAQAGMTEAEFAAYQQATADARSEAFDALLYKTMATIRRERTKAWKEEETNVRASMTDAINSRPEFRALHLLRTGRWLGEPDREAVKVKLDRAWLVETYGADALALLPKGVPPIYADADTTDADTIAAMAGFRNGDEMVRSLMGVEQLQSEMRGAGDKRTVRARLIDEQTAATMIERHGDLLNDGTIEEEALAAINNDRQAEVIAAEARQLGKGRGVAPTPYRLAREWAARKIAEGKVVDVASRSAIQRYARAVAKAGRSAEAAFIAGDVDEAFRQKQSQMLNQALLVEAKRAADDVEAAVTRLGKIAKRATMKSVDQEYLDRAHALLEKFDFRPRSQRSINEQESFAVWAAGQQANGIDIVIPPRLEDAGVPYSRMSVEELKGLDDSVKQVIHLGRLKQKLLDAKDQRDFDEVVGEALSTVEGLRQRNPNNRMSPNIADKLKAHIASADAALLKMETVFDWLDDGNPNGTFNRVVFRRIADAQTREREMMGDYIGRIQGLMKALPKETIKRWSEHVTIPEFLNRETGQPWDMTRDQLISIALNVGNEGNFDKLARGYGWSPDAIMRVLNRELKPEEWTLVQSLWDTIETLWPQIASMEKRLNGVEPEKVERRAFVLNDGTTMNGGYYPVVYDTAKDLTAEQQAAAAGDALFENIYTRATTPRGFTKARTAVARPVLLSLAVLNRHVAEVIHDVTHREAVIDADRFLSDRRIVKAIRGTLGPEVQRQLRPWLQHIANEWAIDRRGAEGWDKLAKTLRTHSTIIGMGYRLSTILMQIGGYANSTEQIGVRWMASGFRATMGTPAKIAQSFDFVMEKSGEVRFRMDTMERDINANVRDLQGRRGILADVRRFAFHGIGYMDRVVVIPTWMGAYNKALHEGMTDADAVFYADKMVRNSQGAGSAKDLSSVQRGSEWMRLATMFYSYANTFYNRQRSIARDAGDAVAARRASDFPELLARSFWLFAVAPLVPALIGAGLNGNGPEEDEDWGMWAMQHMFFGLFLGVPVIRDIAGSAASGFDYSFTPASRMIETAIKTGKDVASLVDMNEDTEPSGRAVKNAVETIGYVAKLPVGQVSNAAQFITDWANGEVDPQTAGDWLRGLQTGKLEDRRD